MENQIQNESATMEQILNRQEQFLVKNRKPVLAVVIAILVIVAGFILTKNYYIEPRENKASTAIAKAQELFATAQYDKALKGDKGVEGFIAVAENYSGTDAANLAKLYAGLCYANLEKWQDAVKYLEDFSTQDDAMISPAAIAALGDAYANTNNVDKAIDCFKKAAKMADDASEEGVNNTIAPTYLVKAARLLESQKKNDDALEIYQNVKKTYVNSAAQQDIDKYIERLTK